MCPAPRSRVDSWLGWSAGRSRRCVAAVGIVRRPAQDGRSTEGRDEVERAEEAVAELDGRAEDRDRARRAAWRPVGGGGLPRASDLGHALLQLARQAARGGRAALAGKEDRDVERELRR